MSRSTTAASKSSASLASTELNQLREQDRAAHRWYRFVLSYPPHLVQDYVQKFELDYRHRLLDPFSGTGTTVVEGKKLGISSVGVEANSVAHFAGTVKLNWTPKPSNLLKEAQEIGNAASSYLSKNRSGLRELPEDSQKIILTNSISPIPLHKTLVLLEKINNQSSSLHRDHLRLALVKAVVTSVSNLHFGPEVGIGKAKLDADVVEAWLREVSYMVEDLVELQTLKHTDASIHCGDSREIACLIEPNSIDAVITSPPYPNEKDYTRTTRLESVLLGFTQDKAGLRSLKNRLLRSNTRNVYKADQDDQWVSKHPEVQRIAQAIEDRRIELGKTSGFERLYHRAVKLYFGGMAKHLAELRSVLRPGAQLAYVVGDQKSYLQVMIRTGELLGDIAQGLGYEVTAIDLFRTRLATATKEQMREEVVLLRWSGKTPRSPYPFSDEPL